MLPGVSIPSGASPIIPPSCAIRRASRTVFNTARASASRGSGGIGGIGIKPYTCATRRAAPRG